MPPNSANSSRPTPHSRPATMLTPPLDGSDSQRSAATYSNPVYPRYFADPYVWRAHDGWYYAVGTTVADERDVPEPNQDFVFPLLRSTDLVHWESVGHALRKIAPSWGESYWAPEVAAANGTYYLYYSVGHGDRSHHIRVAVSESGNPAGPYVDTGNPVVSLTNCPFAIDPHPFQDDDGKWYLFHARDFLDTDGGAHVGTALLVAPLHETMTRLDGEAKPILRARYPWQLFQASREMYGAVYDWHTLEGPCVRKHNGLYYCFYSGGRWENETYGVDYGVAAHVMGPYECRGSEAGPRVLKTVARVAYGPGHNSIVSGPDGSKDYLVYHAWDADRTARRMCVDPLIWTQDGPRCLGPSVEPRPLPT